MRLNLNSSLRLTPRTMSEAKVKPIPKLTRACKRYLCHECSTAILYGTMHYRAGNTIKYCARCAIKFDMVEEAFT